MEDGKDTSGLKVTLHRLFYNLEYLHVGRVAKVAYTIYITRRETCRFAMGFCKTLLWVPVTISLLIFVVGEVLG